jgi:hypothetical protein
MLSWLLLALAAAIVVAVTLQHWNQSRRLRRARKPTAPRLPVVLAHGFLASNSNERERSSTARECRRRLRSPRALRGWRT